MATGASTAHLADRAGRRAQRRAAAVAPPRVHRLAARHSELLARRQQDGSRSRSIGRRTRRSSRSFVASPTSSRSPASKFFPVSALAGDNIVKQSTRTPWFVEAGAQAAARPPRDARGPHGDVDRLIFPVQLVLRPDLDFRGYAGTIAAGRVTRGDLIKVLPSGKTSKVSRIVTWDGELPEAFAPMSVTLTLEDEIDIRRASPRASRPSASCSCT